MFIIFVKMIWFSDKLKHFYGIFMVINRICCAFESVCCKIVCVGIVFTELWNI